MKDKIFEQLIAKGKKKEELEQKYSEFCEEAKNFGFEGEQAEKHALRRLISFYSQKTFSSNMVKYDAVFVGYKMTDYGATKQFEEAKELFAVNPNGAVQSGATDAEGNPLFTKGFNKGKPIDLSKAWTRQAFGVGKKQDDEQWEKIIYNMNDEAAKIDLPLFTKLVVLGSDKRNNDKVLNPGIRKDPIVEQGEELADNQVEALINENFGIKTFAELREFAETNQDNYDAICAVKGDVCGVRIGDSKVSSIVNLTNPDVDLENLDLENPDSDNLTCWLSSSYPVDCNEASLGVIALGRPSIRADTNEININAVGIYTPKVYRKPADIKPVSEDEGDEQGKWIK